MRTSRRFDSCSLPLPPLSLGPAIMLVGEEELSFLARNILNTQVKNPIMGKHIDSVIGMRDQS